MTPGPRCLLVVLVFESGLQASEALALAARLEERRRVALHEAAFVTRDVDGTLAIGAAPGAPAAAPDTSRLSRLLPALLVGDPRAELGDELAAAPRFARDLRRAIRAGDTAVVVVLTTEEPRLPIELRWLTGARVLATAVREVTPDARPRAGVASAHAE